MTNSSPFAGIVFAIVVIFAVTCSIVRAEYVQSESLPEDTDGQVVKRPFCNPFSGCGRKRSASADADAEDAEFWKVFRQLMMMQARRQGLESRLNSLNVMRNSKNRLLGPYFDYVADRKKRMSPINEDHNEDDESGTIYNH